MKRLVLVVGLSGALAMSAPSVSAIDASCVGVQTMGAEDLYTGLDANQQQQFSPVIDQIRALRQHTADSLGLPEQRVAELFNDIRQSMPNATDQQVSDTFFENMRRSPDVDAAYSDALRVEFDVHDDEGKIMALASRLPQSGFDMRMHELTANYLSREPQAAGFADNPIMTQLAGIAAASRAIEELGTDYTSQRIAADATQIGFDRENPYAVDLAHSSRQLSRTIVAAHALGAQARLLDEHLRGNLPGAEARRTLMQRDASATGRVIAAQVARAQNRQLRANEALRQVSRIVREVPTPPVQQNSPEQASWARRAAAAVEAVAESVSVTIGAPDLVELAGGQSAQE